MKSIGIENVEVCILSCVIMLITNNVFLQIPILLSKGL